MPPLLLMNSVCSWLKSDRSGALATVSWSTGQGLGGGEEEEEEEEVEEEGEEEEGAEEKEEGEGEIRCESYPLYNPKSSCPLC